MRIDISLLPALAAAFMLAFARVGAMVMLLPNLGEHGIPARVRLLLALAIAFCMAPGVANAYHDTAPSTSVGLVILIAQEVTVGVLVGAMARIIMSSLNIAGYLIATQTGLAYAQTLDPTQGTQGAVMGNFLSLLGTLMVFLTNLHHLAIGAIAGSYKMLPPGGHLPMGDMAQLTINLVSGSFALGFQLAAPFLVFGLVFNIGLGVLARLMPQMQVYFVGVPLSIFAGFLIFALVITAMMGSFLDYFTGVMHEMIPLK